MSTKLELRQGNGKSANDIGAISKMKIKKSEIISIFQKLVMIEQWESRLHMRQIFPHILIDKTQKKGWGYF